METNDETNNANEHSIVKNSSWQEADLGRDVRKPINANPGLNGNRSINFSCIKMCFTAYVLCSLRLLKLKIEGQTIQANSPKSCKLYSQSKFSLTLG